MKQYKLLSIIITFICTTSVILVSLSPSNPDWSSYEIIYESGGSWLKEQSRDPLFIFLISQSSYLFGNNSYELFRYIISIVFILFVAFLSYGKIIPFNRENNNYIHLIQFSIAIFALSVTRFTVQIREGIALTLIIIGLSYILKIEKRNKRHRVYTFLAVLVITSGILMHLGTIIILFVVLASLFIEKIPNIKYINLISVSIIFIYTLYLLINGAASTLDGDLNLGIESRIYFEKIIHWTPLKIILWMAYGSVCFIIYKNVNKINPHLNQGQKSKRISFIFDTLSGPITFSLLLSIYILITISFPAFYIGQFVRLLNTILGITLLFVSVYNKKSLWLVYSGIVLISHQAYSIIDSIQRYS